MAERPWLGHGFGVVWGLGELSWLPGFESTVTAVHAHNGFLNLATELGLVGAAAAIGHVLVTLYRCLRLLTARPSSFALFGCALVLAFVVINLAEVRLFAPLLPDWMVFVAISVAAARGLERGRHLRRRDSLRGDARPSQATRRLRHGS